MEDRDGRNTQMKQLDDENWRHSQNPAGIIKPACARPPRPPPAASGTTANRRSLLKSGHSDVTIQTTGHESLFCAVLDARINALILAGRGGGRCPQTVFSRLLRSRLRWRADTCIPDAPFKPDKMNFDSFLGQVRSLTYGYDVIRNLRTITKCRNFATLPMRQAIFLRKVKHSESNKPPGTYSHFVYLWFFMQVIWGQVNRVTSPIISLWGIPKLFILQHK